MQLDKKRIEFLKGSQNIEEISKGYSGAYKYLFIKDGKKYFLKIGKLKIAENVEQVLTENGISHPRIVACGKYDEELYYIIEEYIESDTLKDILDNYDKKFIYEYGFEIGKQYRNLRLIYPDMLMDSENYNNYMDIVDKKINILKSLLKSNDKVSTDDIKFLNYAMHYLKKNRDFIKNGSLVYGHADIKPSNFLINKKKIIAVDIENTTYKELSLSMLWSYARRDFKDEKNLAFAKGYLDALYNFTIPENILKCFNYSFFYNFIEHCIYYLTNEKYDELSFLIRYIIDNYIDGENILLSEKLKSDSVISSIDLLKGYDFSIVKGSYSPCNLTFKCQKDNSVYFFKIMEIPSNHFDRAKNSYKLLSNCGIPICPIIKYGCLLEGKVYYTISDFFEDDRIKLIIKDTFFDGVKMGELVAKYLIKLKGNELVTAKVFDKDVLYESILKDIDKAFGEDNYSEYIHWSKEDIIKYVYKYIKGYEGESISLIHGDIKYENILYNGDKIYFVDNESLEYSYDIMNFFYNIHGGFSEKGEERYKGFVNGYLKYMNKGKIPSRIQKQAKLLLIYYVVRSINDIVDKKGRVKRIDIVRNSCKKYIDEDKDIEWLN